MLNYTPPTATRPSLLTYKEVVSCFHEMGHSIHYLTSRSTHARFHQNTPRDFLEIPSRSKCFLDETSPLMHDLYQ